ncbi:hypothetical protein DCAR_0102039 [Daucus carota subsp. sativus]|uniref:Uncharacterized protein n=1 Tax=Daucus carota subsp. sativus TaxID=79200 RepID=A0A166GTX4_DAUCS|nr:hypothetical protein DCAR_0102039 [Daucus carota subsp. sativus]
MFGFQIRTLGMLRSRFQSLPGAFNDCLIPEERGQAAKKKGLKATLSSKFDAFSLQILYSLKQNNCKKADHRRPKCPTGENDLSGGYESVTELNGGNGARKSAGHTSATKRKTLGLKRPKLQVRRSSITQDSQTNSASEVNMGQHVHAASLLSSLSHWEAQHNNSDMHF